MKLLLAFALLVLASTGCANAINLTIHSEPEGATVYANDAGQRMGTTPVTLKYKAPPGFWERASCFQIQRLRVMWVSGATATWEQPSLCSVTGRNQQYVFNRPSDPPGRDQDAMAAIADQSARVAQAEAEARRLETLAQILAAAAAPAAGSSPPVGLASGSKLMLFGGENHRTYLGCLNCSQYDSDSVFNQYGTHGSQFSSASILNQFTEAGSKYSNYGACNPYASDPPVIVDGAGQFYGRLTVNRYHGQRTGDAQLLAWLAGVCAR